MKLSVYSLKKTLFEGDAKSVNCKTAVGEITILDHHKPLISMLTPGVTTIVDENDRKHFANIQSGFLKVQEHNRVTLLIDEAV